MRVNIDHFEGVNVTASSPKGIQGVDLNTSGVIRIGKGYKPM